MKRLHTLLNIMMGAFAGVFLGHSAYVVWQYKTHPQVYALWSAPWYTSILVYGTLTLGVEGICALLKALLKHFERRRRTDATEP